MTTPADPVHSNIDARFPQAMERAARVRLMVFDVDGVLTDGRLLVGPEEKSARRSTRSTATASSCWHRPASRRPSLPGGSPKSSPGAPGNSASNICTKA